MHGFSGELSKATLVRLHTHKERCYPRLVAGEPYSVTSQATWDYNCIAFAAGEEDEYWWPDPDGIGRWPEGVRREETLDAFVELFLSLGYALCESWESEEGFEKVALYVSGGEPTHAAVEQPNGKWKSKLGSWEDIEHENPHSLETIGGIGSYGLAHTFLKRKR
jgi:hypothetical protein